MAVVLVTGMTDAQRDRIVQDRATVAPLLRAGATTEIDTRKPLDEVADKLETIARLASRTTGGRR